MKNCGTLSLTLDDGLVSTWPLTKCFLHCDLVAHLSYWNSCSNLLLSTMIKSMILTFDVLFKWYHEDTLRTSCISILTDQMIKKIWSFEQTFHIFSVIFRIYTTNVVVECLLNQHILTACFAIFITFNFPTGIFTSEDFVTDHILFVDQYSSPKSLCYLYDFVPNICN